MSVYEAVGWCRAMLRRTPMFRAWCAYGDGLEGAFLNSGGCCECAGRLSVVSVGKKLQRAFSDCCCLAQKYVGVALFFELPLVILRSLK